MTIKVLIVDDSALMRKLLTGVLDRDPEIEVVGVAPDPYIAREKIKALNPDVVTLDIEMPRMDGLTFLANLMRLRPTPVVMISTLTQKGADASLEALHMGAVDYVAKPRFDVSANLESAGAEIVEKVKMAARANVSALTGRRHRPSPPRPCSSAAVGPADLAARAAGVAARAGFCKVIAIGASTGGTEAIAQVLAALPVDVPPVVVAQHIPEMFSRSFSERVDRLSPLAVREARDGDVVLPGHAYVAPGNRHLTLQRDGARLVCVLTREVPVNRHRPSVDVLFESVAEVTRGKAVGVILTGMGSDGARGLKSMREGGACTLAQDEATSVVWGMPGSAVELGAVDRVLPIERIADEIVRCVQDGPARAKPRMAANGG